jgi:hypothetical protein
MSTEVLQRKECLTRECSTSRVVREDLRLVNSLRETANQYLNLKKQRAETAVKLFDTFLKDYVFHHEDDRAKIASRLREFFGKEKVRVAAVDGTKYERSRRGCLVFYVLAAPLVYELDIAGDNPTLLRVEEEPVRSSVMAVIPVPLSESFLLEEPPARSGSESGLDRDEIEEAGPSSSSEEQQDDAFVPQKIGRVDVALMKLAETYTIHLCLEKVNPDVLMIDGSLFESYSYTNRSTDTINLYKGSILDLHLSRSDFEVLKSLPTSSELRIPSPPFKSFLILALSNVGNRAKRLVQGESLAVRTLGDVTGTSCLAYVRWS